MAVSMAVSSTQTPTSRTGPYLMEQFVGAVCDDHPPNAPRNLRKFHGTICNFFQKMWRITEMDVRCRKVRLNVGPVLASRMFFKLAKRYLEMIMERLMKTSEME
jgi:hypothetical protein